MWNGVEPKLAIVGGDVSVVMHHHSKDGVWKKTDHDGLPNQ